MRSFSGKNKNPPMYQNLGKFSEPTKKWVVFLCSAPNYFESPAREGNFCMCVQTFLQMRNVFVADSFNPVS